MGLGLGCCKRTESVIREIKLVCVGIDGDGKTTTLKLLRGDDPSTVMSTNGFSKVQMAFSDAFDVTVYDLGGGEKIREIWEIYYAEVHGAIFVVDVSGQRMNEALECLQNFVKHPDLFGKPILIVLNKAESGKVDEIDFAEMAGLHSICQEKKQACFVTHINELINKSALKRNYKTVRQRAESVRTPLFLQFCNFADKIIQDYVVLNEGAMAGEERLKKKQEESRKARKLRLMQMEHEQRINGDAANANGTCETALNGNAESSPSVPSVDTATPLSDEVFRPEPTPVPRNKVAPMNPLNLAPYNGDVQNRSVMNLRAPEVFNIPNGHQTYDASSSATVREMSRLKRAREGLEQLERRKREEALTSTT